MKTIQAHAHILTDEGANASSVKATLETYLLSSQRWVKLASAKSDTRGIWQVSATRLKQGVFYAPVLRLIEAGDPVPRVLALGGYISYDKTKQVLSVDFGRIERLAETAYRLTASASIFKRSKLTIAGQAKKARISFTNLLRAGSLTAADRERVAIVAGAERSAIKANPVLENFDAEVLKFRAKEAGLQSTILQKDALLTSRNVELAKTRSQVTALEQQLSSSIVLEKKLKEQNKTFVEESKRKTPIQSIAANIGTEMDIANKKLRSEKRPYRFGRIELDLRGTISTDGQSMTLASLVDLKTLGGAAVLPGVKFEILPDTIPTESITDVDVPDVTGLTETAVRRLLQAVGLRLEMVHKSIEPTTNIPIGLSIQQSPVAGTKLARTEIVLVVFAIAKTNAEEVT